MALNWKIIVGAALVAGVFLLGFVPQFLEKRRLQVQLDDTQLRLSTAERQIEIDEIRSLAGRMLLEASRQNYGTAREFSTSYFNKVRELAEKSGDSPLKTSLLQLLNSRDSITTGLAKGNTSVIPELQSLLAGTHGLPNAENTVR